MTMAGMADPTRMSQKEIELSELVRLKLKAESDAAQAKGSLDNAQQTMAQGGTPGAVEMMIGNNYVVTNLKMQLVQTDIVLKSIMKQGSESDQYQSLKKSRDATEDMLNEMMAEERARTTAAYLDSLQGQAASTQHDLDEINKTIEKLTMEQAENAAHLAEYLANKDEQTALAEEIRRVTNQTDVLNTALQQLEMNSVSWMAHPETPDTPSFPVLKWTLTVSMVLGLALSLTVSFLRELMDTSVRSPRDIARVGQLNLLGTIPHEDDDPQAAGVPLASVIYAAPSSMLAEQLRQVRTRLQHTTSLETTRSILVTSPGPGDGKTTIACNLAAGLALNGHRILLVDANFRRPELHKLFGTGNEVGFSNVLSSVENFESAVRQTRVPNLDIMASGPKPANATELLESQLLTDFIDRALEEYDHVVFDSGPMLVVSETVALAPRVDGVVTVVRARNNSRGLLQRMKENLRQLKAEHLGVVLNGVRSTGGGYYGRNIKAYYEYQNQNGDAA
jgi:capsular exopolysaccharide synthesis family protein